MAANVKRELYHVQHSKHTSDTIEMLETHFVPSVMVFTFLRPFVTILSPFVTIVRPFK